MLTCFKPIYPINKTLSDYCKRTTNESIRKLTEKYSLERNNPKIKNPLVDEDDYKPKFNIYDFFAFHSISTIAFFFYKRLK